MRRASKTRTTIKRLFAPVHRIAVAVFFVTVATVGLLILDDYGISFDEAIQRDHGRVMLTYWADRLGLEAPNLERLYRAMPAYGMFFPGTSLFLELAFGVDGSQFSQFRLRHLLTFSLFLAALLAFYRLLRYRWPANRWYPLLGCALLVLSPRIFAHAFFNPKDHIMLALYVIATYTLVRFLSERTLKNLWLHALATGFALGSRQAGILIPLATVFLLLYEAIAERTLRSTLLHVAGFLVVALPIGLFWNPYLYMPTGDGLARSVANVTEYGWGGMVLFNGIVYLPSELPWYYLPVWIGLSTPIVHLILLLLGGGLTCWMALRVPWSARRLYRDGRERADLIAIGLGLAPLLAVMVLRVELYNGWRHLHFVYPFLVYLMVVGFDGAYRRLPLPTSLALGIGMYITLHSMVRIHPHQQVYFNEVAWRSPNLLDRYELDYWGVSYREAFVELAQTIPSGERRLVKCSGWACMTNLRSLPPGIIDKFVETEDWVRADYFATNFYYPTHREQTLARQSIFGLPVVEMAPGGHIIIGIYPSQMP